MAPERDTDRLIGAASSSDRPAVLLALCEEAPAPQFWRTFFQR